MAQVVTWPAPTKTNIAAVMAGCVVSVMIRGRAATTRPPILPASIPIIPTLQGVIPHVVYVPDIPPDGTGGFQTWDTFTGLFGPQVEDRPSSLQIGGIYGEQIHYEVDLGKPFFCPWNGHLFIEGGQLSATTSPTSVYDLLIVNTMPLAKGIRRARTMLQGEPAQYDVFHRTGEMPRSDPTISFQDVPSTTPGNQIPRGAYAVQVSDTTDIQITPTGGGTAVPIRIQPGTAVPLGWLALGTFAASGGSTIPLISFHVKIA